MSTAGRADGLDGALLLDECQIPLQECERLDDSLALALHHLSLPPGWSLLGRKGANSTGETGGHCNRIWVLEGSWSVLLSASCSEWDWFNGGFNGDLWCKIDFMQHLLMASIFPFFPRKPQFVVEGADTIARFFLLNLCLFKSIVYCPKMVLHIPFYVGCLLWFIQISLRLCRQMLLG